MVSLAEQKLQLVLDIMEIRITLVAGKTEGSFKGADESQKRLFEFRRILLPILRNALNNLMGTKESIEGTKMRTGTMKIGS